jgi:hypothetical protein
LKVLPDQHSEPEHSATSHQQPAEHHVSEPAEKQQEEEKDFYHPFMESMRRNADLFDSDGERLFGAVD